MYLENLPTYPMQGPQNHIHSAKMSLIFLKTLNPHRYQLFLLLKPSEIVSLANIKERANISINNEYMVDKTKCDVVSECVTSIFSKRS